MKVAAVEESLKNERGRAREKEYNVSSTNRDRSSPTKYPDDRTKLLY